MSRCRRRILAICAACALAFAGRTARADSGDDEPDEHPHYVWALALASIQLAIPAAYYWDTQKSQEVDWTLTWSWKSWRDKLLPPFSAVRFDTNPFHVNALRHPLTGIGDYEIGRTSELGMRGSMILAWVTGALWEYFVEYREYPAINDMIMNGVGGVALGEPLYQIGELFRGDDATWLDHAKTTLSSPFATAGDLAGVLHRHRRPRAWREIRGTLGAAQRRVDDGRQRDELTASLDIDLVHDRNYVQTGAREGATGPGAWSRFALNASYGDQGEGNELVNTEIRSRTSFLGHYAQDADGNGVFYGLGTGFLYRRDRLAAEWDRVALAHVVGPQMQIVRRHADYTLRWDLAAYLDFGLIQATVFGPRPPFPAPPPYLSTLQANGYYDGGGATAETRVRLDRGPWRLAGELGVTQLWSLDFADRDTGSGTESETRLPLAPITSTGLPLTPHGVADARVYAHAELGYVIGDGWGVAGVLDGAVRHGTWSSLSRTTSDGSVGVQATHAF